MAYLSRGSKEYSVLIDTETLEEMAANQKSKEKYLGILDEATGKLSDLREQLSEEEGQEVARLGISIGKDGSVSYFAELEKMSEKQRERIEKSKEKKKEQSDQAEKTAKNRSETAKAEPYKRTRVTAQTAEELLEKIRKVDWEKVPELQAVNGSRLDLSI